MALKLYRDGSAIILEGYEANDIPFIPGACNYRRKGEDFLIKCLIRNDEYSLLTYANVTDRNDDSFATEADFIAYLNDLINSPASVDNSTGATNCIDYEHHEIHSGDHYNIAEYALNQAASTEIEFVVTTPNTTKWGHLTFEVYSSLGATVELFESSSAVVGGTPVTPRNNNRNSSNTSGMTVLKDPTSITDGNRAAGFLAGAGRTAGFATRSKENILMQNTTYLLRITSLVNSNNISWEFEWYEHQNKL